MRRSLVTANSEEFIFGDMDEIYFENDDYFLPNGDDESIWQIMDTIVIEKSSSENEPINSNNNSTISSSNNINKRSLSEISSNNNNHLTNNNNNSNNKSFTENISNKKTKAEPDIPKFETTDKDEVIFFSNTKDPFAQTTWMVLLEKKIPFKYIEVSSDKLPDWFLKLNPEGTIPAIKHEETVIYDCNIINEFLEDLFPDKSSLLPKLPHEKAKARLIIKKIQELISPFSELLQAQTLETQIHRGQALRKKLKEVNEFLSKFNPISINGPYLLGNEFSLLDCVLLPFYERMSVVLPHVRNWKIPSTSEFQLLEDWYFRASKRLSFQETRKIKDSKYEEYLLKEYQIVGTII